MRIANCQLTSCAAYCQSKHIYTPRDTKEKGDDHEKRTWRERMHVTADGFVFIPPMAFKFAIATAASFLRMRIPGKGKSEYGKCFKAGILIPEPLVLPIKAEDVQGEWHQMNADGRRGSGSRVPRCMPTIPHWSGVVKYYVLDDNITPDVFERHVRESGILVGIGQHRPENGGFCGRFKVDGIEWTEA